MPHAIHQLMVAWTYFFFYCVGGWVVESTYCSVAERHFINRGFLNGPYLPIYGCGGIASALLLSRIGSPLGVFLTGGALSCLLEYVTSYVMERMYHARWWDYSDKPLNLQGRIWAGGFLQFGCCCLLVTYVSQPPLAVAVASLSGTQLAALSCLSATLMLSDLVVTHVGIAGLRAKMDSLKQETASRLESMRELLPSRPELARVKDWGQVMEASLRRRLAGRLADRLAGARDMLREATPELRGMPNLPQVPSLDELASSFSSRLTDQELRLLRAFPSLRPSDYRRVFDEYYQKVQGMARATAERVHDAVEERRGE